MAIHRMPGVRYLSQGKRGTVPGTGDTQWQAEQDIQP